VTFSGRLFVLRRGQCQLHQGVDRVAVQLAAEVEGLPQEAADVLGVQPEARA
jgi:hypothetical protein